MKRPGRKTLRTLVVVLGDQLDSQAATFDGFDPAQDSILQMEVREEAGGVPQHKARLAFFFAAMRHFAEGQRALGRQVHYVTLDDPANTGSFAGELRRWAEKLKPERVCVTDPGDWRVRQIFEDLPFGIDFVPDRHTLCPPETFADFLAEHRHPVMETFYRFMRRRLGILMDEHGAPLGGAWNFDSENRAPLGRDAPPIPPPLRFQPDAITTDVLALVERAFPHNPGRLDAFAFPVTAAQSRQALADFVTHRLGDFGRYQDAMQGDEWLLFHSHLSGPLNLHLLDPREVLDAVLSQPDNAPLNSVEGFVRQVIGWREFVRGVYWRFMPDYAALNALDARLPVPRFFWTGDTDMHCLAQAIGHTIQFAYAHHIERLMVLGLFLQLLGVAPYEVHRWHMSMLWDAVDWVSLPNTLGMSQYGDGGLMGTKPYVASGRYIDRMSDHCGHCRYDPTKALGDDACPFTTLYWDFLARHKPRFARNHRMRQQYANLARRDDGEITAIRHRADALKAKLTAETYA